MKSFMTLLRREWLQHKFGWIVVACAPMVLAALLLAFGQMRLDIDGDEVSSKLSQLPAVGLVLAATLGTAALTMLAAWATSIIQVPGLARRDQQDRSIEFWLSLPTGHVPSIAAPMLAHLILFPAAAMLIGLLGGQLLSLALVSKLLGVSAWFSAPWGTVVTVVVLLVLRALLGLVLATLWLSPLILLVMVASAWLKRWGLPAVMVSYLVLGMVLDKLYGNPIVWELTGYLTTNAGLSMISTRQGSGLQFRPGEDPTAMLAAFPGWIASDMAQALALLASPQLLAALAVSAGCFALLVQRRRRGA